MTRTTYHENPHDNDADDDKDKVSGIVAQPVVCGSGFFGISFITHSESKYQKSPTHKHVGP
jgi:hypothetical protein